MIIRDLEKIDSQTHLSKIRLRNENEHKKRLEEIYAKLPEYKKLENSISTIAFNEVRKRLNKNREAYSPDYEAEIRNISAKKIKLLTDNGYAADYLDPIYDCPICQDWGEVDGKVCSCVMKLRIEELYQKSNLFDTLEKENFETFSLEPYSQAKYEDRDLTPYENAERQYNKAKKFVENFETNHGNILMYGETGLGKTFLSNCIAKELLDKGHTVLYLSSNELFEDVLSNYIMSGSYTDKSALEPIYEYIYTSDLLIIDDLGSEVLSSFVKSQLFEIINKRIITNRSTLITTNLSLEVLQDRYTERVMSRIADKYILYPLYGDDIRYHGGKR